MPELTGWTAPPGFLDYGPNGAGMAAGRPRVADPAKEYVSAGRWFRPGELPRALDATLDDVMRRFGPRIYDAMDLDPAARSAKDTLKFAVVAGGMDLAPAVEPKAGSKSRSADEALAAELVDFCWRSVERVGDFEDQAFDLLESVRVGAKLAKVTVEPAEGGPDAGKVVLRSFKVKPNDLWRFVVDEWMTVVGIEARDPGGGDRVVYRPDPFVWMSWEPRDGDPRGTSVYHAANTAWDQKMVTWPELRKYLYQFASGKVIGTTSPNDVAPRPPIDATGAAIAGAPAISPQEYMARCLGNTQNGSVYVGPAGSTVQVLFPSGDGAAFHKAMELFNQEITYAILGTTRANREAQHGSKADNEGGQDILSLKAERGRKALSAAIRRALRLLVAANHGDDVAARLTPLVTFGQAEHRDRPALWGAAAGLMTSGYLGESQVAELDAMIGLPIRDAEADAEAAEGREAKALEAQQALAAPAEGEEEEEEEGVPAEFARGAAIRRMVGTSKAAVARGAVAKGQCGPGGGAPCHRDHRGGAGAGDATVAAVAAKARADAASRPDVRANLVIEAGPPRTPKERKLLDRAEARGAAAVVVAETLGARVDRGPGGAVAYHRGDDLVHSIVPVSGLDPATHAQGRATGYIEPRHEFVTIDHQQGVPLLQGHRTLAKAEAYVARGLKEDARGARFRGETGVAYRIVKDPGRANLLEGHGFGLHRESTVTIRLLRRGKPAEFAASPSGPWGTDDLIAARGMIDAALPSRAALKRWSKGAETLANRLTALGWLADDAKATLRARGEALAIDLDRLRAGGMRSATFAGAAVADDALDAVGAEIEAEAADEGLGPEAWFLISAFLEAMGLYLRRSHLAGSMVLVGPIDLTSAEGEALKSAHADQLRYLAGFAMALASGKQAPSRIGQRAGQYGDSVWTVAMAVQQADAIRRGMTEARSVLGASERTCSGKPDAEGRPSCVAEAGKKWQPVGVVSLPGRRKCGGACKCHLEYRAGRAGGAP